MTDYQKHIDERKAKGKADLLGFAPQLTAAGIGWVVLFFDGSGDSGQVEATKYLPTDYDDANVPITDLRYPYDLDGFENTPEGVNSQTLEDAAWSLTPDGFENNEGGYGAVIFDVAAQKITVNYSYRVESSEEADYEV